ncbi:class I SAM-dependent methyltransferase [Palleronia sp. KMU-117]|uniref:class I SAM-dependent methyltransferase n=1 Tax=Palleronia sp. KMU-117 TaxID=3434108 RepID=UPI003D729423
MAAALFPGKTSLIESLNRLRPRIMPIEDLIAAVPAGARVLDIGCGAGLFLGLLAAAGRTQDGVGFDTSKDAIALAQSMQTRLPTGHRIRFERLSVDDPWPEGTFDAVSLIDVMHHIPRKAQIGVLEMAVGKLRPGGRLIYKDMADRPFLMAAANRLHDLVIARDWIEYLPLETVRGTLAEMGFTVIEERSARRLWYMHEMLVMEAPA